MEGCIGLKTGYTMAAGRTLVSCAERDGQRLVAVTLQDGNDWADHAALYDYGFSTYPAQAGWPRWGRQLASGPVETGDAVATVPLVAAEQLLLARWRRGRPWRLDIELDAASARPPSAGDRGPGEAVFTLVNGAGGGPGGRCCVAPDVAPRVESALSILKQGLPG